MRLWWRSVSDRIGAAVSPDVKKLTSGPLALVLLLAIPATVFFIGEREISERRVRVLVAGSRTDPAITERLVYVLRESAQFDVTRAARPVADPYATSRRLGLDILLNYEGSDGKRSMFSAESDPRRLAELESLAAGIARAEVMIANRLRRTGRGGGGDAPAPLMEENWWARPDLYEDLFMLGPLPVQPLSEYFPQAADPRSAGLPALVLLVATLLPFALTIALRSDREPWRAPLEGASAGFVPALVTVFEIVAILLLAESMLGVHLKAGTIRMMLLLLAAALASAYLALAVLAVSSTAVESACLAVLYAIGVATFVATPLAHREAWAVILAQLWPGSHVGPVFTAWLFGAPYDAGAWRAAGRLLLLAGAAWSVAFSVIRMRMRRSTRAEQLPDGIAAPLGS